MSFQEFVRSLNRSAVVASCSLALALLVVSCGPPSAAVLGTRPSPEPTSTSASPLALRQQLEAAIQGQESKRSLLLADQMEALGLDISDTELLALEQVVARAPVEELPELAPGSVASGLIALRRALVAQHAGDAAGARRGLEAAGTSKRLQSRVRAIRSRSSRKVLVDPRRIAVLLPMSGPHAKTAEELWAGLSLAFKDAHRGSDAILTLYDTKGSEAGARAAALAALRDGSLVAIGPAGRLESRAAAAIAFSEGMPIALLAPESEGSNAHNGVFRVVLSPGFEAAQAALVAVELGYRLVAVMAPRDELGQEQAEAFARAARAAGAQVVAIGSYGPDSAHLEQDFRDFLGLHVLTNARLRQHLRSYGAKSWKSFSPELAFDFLYLPDDLVRGALVASYLPFFNVELRHRDEMGIGDLHRKHGGRMPRVVQLMVPSAWNDSTLAARGGDALEGALLLSTCPGGIGTDLSALGTGFAEDFERANGRAASAAAAAAYDAMTLVLNARTEALGHGASREGLRRALQSAKLRAGLCGSLHMNASGQVEGQIEVLRVESGTPEIYEY